MFFICSDQPSRDHFAVITIIWLEGLFADEPVAGTSPRQRHLRKPVKVVIMIPEGLVDHGQPLEVMPGDVLIRHADAAMELDRLLADEAAGFADLDLGGGDGAVGRERGEGGWPSTSTARAPPPSRPCDAGAPGRSRSARRTACASP